jgi:uridine kinase
LTPFRFSFLLPTSYLPPSIKKSIVIGIAGGTGSGKTTVTNRILEHLDKNRVVVIQHDSYYKDVSAFGGLDPGEINFDHPDSLETDLLICHIEEMKAGHAIAQPVYNFTTHQRMEATCTVAPKEIIIVDGILIFADKRLRNLMDIKVFVDTDADERLIRRLRRDILERGRSIESVIRQYVATVKPMHIEFVEPSKVWADIIIPRGAENTVATDMLVTKIKTMLACQGRP